MDSAETVKTREAPVLQMSLLKNVMTETMSIRTDAITIVLSQQVGHALTTLLLHIYQFVPVTH